MWPERISNNVCTLRDKMLSEMLISCISWFISAIQLNIAALRNPVYLDNRHCFHLKERFLNTSGVRSGWAFLHKLPEVPLMSLYQGLGKERPECRRSLKQCVLAKCLEILDTLETWFLFVTLFYVFAAHFSTPIRTFIAVFQEWWRMEMDFWDKNIQICTHSFKHLLI